MRIKTALLVGTLVLSAAFLTGCPKANGYIGVPVFSELKFGQMLGLQIMPGDTDHALLMTKDGVLRRANLSNDAEAATVFLDLRSKIIPSPQDEEGLLGLAYAPDYPTSGTFYVYYTAGLPRRSVVSRFHAAGNHADPASEQVLLEIPQPYANHNGGAMTFGPDGMLYIGPGDGGGGGDPSGNGQNTNTLLGKILRIDVSGGGAYTIPPDNPFANGGGRPEIFAYGLRNPWRLNFDSATGELWAGDVGQDSWEEVDHIVSGGNYGWNITEGNHCYPPGATCDMAGKIPPRVEYSHDFGCAIIGGFVYHGRSLPELEGWYIYGDYCSGNVWAVDVSKDEGAAVPLTTVDGSITSFAQDKAGEVYIVSFNNKIMRLVAK